MTPIDLSDEPKLAAATDAGLQVATGCIPGFTAVRIECMRTKAATPTHVVRIMASGWAPTLHEADILLSHVTRTDPLDPALLPEVLDAIGPALEGQRARAEAGLSHGLSRPLPLKPRKRLIDNRIQRPPIEMRHLHIDASLAAVAADSALVDLPAMLRNGVHKLLDTDADHDAEPHGGEHVVVGDHDVLLETGGIRAVGTSVVLHAGTDVSARFDGMTLRIGGCPLAETILVAAARRPLGDLVRLHRALDERTVGSAATGTDARGSPAIVIELEPRWVPWGTIETDRAA